MSESGFPQPPGGQRVASSYTPPDRSVQIQRVTIVKRPERLENLRHEIRVRGEVTASTQDGRVRIRTPQGEIVVQWPPDADTPPPQPGTRVEIEIPPNPAPATSDPAGQSAGLPPTAVEAIVRLETPPTAPPPDPADLLPRPVPAALATPVVLDIKQPPLPPPEILPPLAAPQNPLPVLLEWITPERLPSLLPPALPEINRPLPPQPDQATQKVSWLKSVLKFLPLPPALHPLGEKPSTATAVTVAAPPLLMALEAHDITLSDLLTADQHNLSLPANFSTSPKTPKITDAPTLVAQVVGTSPQGFPLLRLEMAADQPARAPLHFLLHQPMPAVMPGMLLTLAPVDPATQENILQPSITNTTTAGTAAHAQPLPFVIKPAIWPLMNDLGAALQTAAPPVAQALHAMIPNPAIPAQIGPAALFFMAALRGGDLGAWLGERAADTLRRAGRSDLLSRLAQEGAQITRAADAPTGEWRSQAIPLMIDQTIFKMILHTRHEDDPDEQDHEKKGGHTRFLLDLDFGRLGPLQIDGLLRDQRLDLIVRSQQPFAAPMREDMRRLFTRALTETKREGEIGFQSHPEQWVRINAHAQNMHISA